MKLTAALAIAVLGTVLAACDGLPTRAPAQSETSIRTTATVVSIDRTARRVVLAPEDGGQVTVYAGNEIRNLDQIEVGDTVVTDYFRSVVAQVASPDSSDDPIVAIDGARAAEGEAPGAFGLVATDLVVRLLAYDANSGRARVRLPDGSETGVTVPSELRRFVEQRSIGERIQVTIVEAVALSLEEV